MSEFEKHEIIRLNNEIKILTQKLEKYEKTVPEEKPVKKAKPKYTESELYALNKNEQVKILKSLGEKTIPRKEADRVKLILKLA